MNVALCVLGLGGVRVGLTVHIEAIAEALCTRRNV
jgi:hypothetical protein